jgi:septal ring factor EnvC (AmiA/AmiB activator)
MIKSLRYILLVLFLFSSSFVFSQSVKSLRKNKKKIEKEIVYINHLLNSSSKNKKVTVNKLSIVHKQIDNRKKLISNINAETIVLGNNIYTNRKRINKSVDRLNLLKKQYSSIIYNSWLHKSSKNKFIFILASKDFNQAYRRLKYLKQYSDYTENIATIIDSLKTNLSRRNAALILQYKEKKFLSNSLNNEKLALAREKQKHKNYISILNNKQKKLKKLLDAQLRAQNRLQTKIKRLIAREAARKVKRTTVDSKLSKSFVRNKSKLPWPTKTGFISSRFGVHQHPVAKRTKIINNGIDITTDPNSECFAVFDGKVSEVFNSPGLNNIVMIRHGDYLTVYANLSKVYITKGQKVKTSQAIGVIYTDPSEHKTVLKFQVWKNSSKQNPSRWLRK